MRYVLGTLVAGALLVGGLGTAAQAKTEAKAPTCPACKMTLATKKSKANPKVVKIGGKTYYCCDKCDMSKAKTKATK